MAIHKITKGLDVPIAGDPEQKIENHLACRHVAVMAADYPGMKPTMLVQVGDTVQRGQRLFEDKQAPGTFYTAPGAGEVVAIHRGARRALQSVVIALNPSEAAGEPDDNAFFPFVAWKDQSPSEWTGDAVRALLIESGAWTALRARPFGKVADPQGKPRSLFITAMDTNPLAPSVAEVLKGQEDDFLVGVQCLSRLTDGPTFVCKAPETQLPLQADGSIRIEEFAGPHPAGLPGLHIHTLDPVSRDKTVWHLDYQDAIAIGRLIKTGRLAVEVVVSLAGPVVKRPRLLRVRMGASLDALTEGELESGDNRVISGSILCGQTASGDALGYLGRYHRQITALAEGHRREMFGWIEPGANKFSVVSAFVSSFLPAKKFAFTTSTNGGERAIVPIGVYERVMPMDILPTFLLRSLAAGDIEKAEKLGCLELTEEDLALCTFVCPSKINYGSILRDNLTVIEKEG